MIRTIERAYKAHKAIPKALYYSPEPRVWSLRRAPRLLSVCADTLRKIDRCHSAVEQSSAKGFAEIGTIADALLRTGLITTQVEDNVRDHESLEAVFQSGRIVRGSPASSTPIPFEDVLQFARDRGYAIPPILVRKGDDRTPELNAFAAAAHLTKRRFAPDLYFLSSRFIVPDPLATVKTVYFIDQLWIVRDCQGIRLLALQIGGAVDDQRDYLLTTTLGYEVFHAVEPWLLIDPQRVILEFLQLAGVPTLSQYHKAAPGHTIYNYHCKYCDAPMIRTETGEGIAEHRDRWVHEECFNNAVDYGFPGDIL